MAHRPREQTLSEALIMRTQRETNTTTSVVPRTYAHLDPIDVVTSKLAKLESARVRMRKVSTLVRNRNAVGLKRLGYGQSKVARLMQPALDSPCAFYADNQVRAKHNQINALRRTAFELETIHNMDAREVCGYEYREDAEGQMVSLRFATKPDKALRAMLRRAGFKLGQCRNTYVRALVGDAIAAVSRFREHLDKYLH
jgi:hypothetical protein